jgi:hypothetical protein
MEIDPQPYRRPLPGDLLKRYWIELGGVNSHLVDQFRPVTITFLAFDKDKSISPLTTVGTGFIVGVGADMGLAMVITAKHVLDGIHQVQSPRSRHAASTPPEFVPGTATQMTLAPEKLKVAWMGSSDAGMMNVAWASYSTSHDIASCVITPQAEDPPPFQPNVVLMDMRIPSVGEIVHIVSIDNQSATELTAPEDRTGKGQVLRVNRRVSIRRGTVTGVHLQGFGQYKWPCFTTSIPVSGGMSGGLVYVPRDGQTIAACGVVCADLDPYQSQTDQTQCGSSVIGCIWPVLALRMPDTLPAPANAPTHTVLDLIKAHRVSMPMGGVDGFRTETQPNGDVRLHRMPGRSENSPSA